MGKYIEVYEISVELLFVPDSRLGLMLYKIPK